MPVRMIITQDAMHDSKQAPQLIKGVEAEYLFNVNSILKLQVISFLG